MMGAVGGLVSQGVGAGMGALANAPGVDQNAVKTANKVLQSILAPPAAPNGPPPPPPSTGNSIADSIVQFFQPLVQAFTNIRLPGL